MALQTTRWDSAEYLKTDEDISAYLDAVLEEGDPALVTHALGIIARAKGINQLEDRGWQLGAYEQFLRDDSEADAIYESLH